MKKLPLFLILFFIISSSAFALEKEDKCTPDVYEIIKHNMKIRESSPKRGDGNVVSSVCKIWPYKTNLLLTAFAYDEGVEYEKKLLISVIDNDTKSVINSFRETINEDALTGVGEHSLKLDTARYQLSDKTRAFGIRFNSSAGGASCGEAYWGDELTLFVPEGKNLRLVTRLNLYQQRWHKGCPAAIESALWEDAVLTISMANTSTNGFYDLVVTAKITVNSEGMPTGNLKNRVEHYTLHYDGKRYKKGKTAVPWWLEI